MPKLNSLDPIETKPFKVKIKKVKYYEYESKSKFVSEVQKIASCNCLIMKAGKESHNKSYCNVSLYLTDEEYEKKVIEKNDIIQLTDKITWEVKKGVTFKTYNSEKLKFANAKDIHTDSNGKKYTEEFLYPYVIKAKIGTWKMYEKYDEYYLAKVGNAKKIELVFDDESELTDFKANAYYIEQDEYECLEQDNHEMVDFIGYGHKRKLFERKAMLDIDYQDDIQKWLMNIEIIE